MQRVFISHSSRDQKAAWTICAALEARGLCCWIATRDVGPGENYQSAIVAAISDSYAMVLVFSKHCNQSNEILRELALAGQKGLLVVPVRIEDVMPQGAFEYELATRQWIDVFKDWEAAIHRVAETLRSVHALPRLVPEDQHRLRLPTGKMLMAGIAAAAIIAGGLYVSLKPEKGPLSFPAAGPATAEGILAQFVTYVQVGSGAPVARYWNRVTADRWVEGYPNGTRDTHNVIRRMILGGCAGTVVENNVNARAYAFLPDRGCPEGMHFRISHGSAGWGIAGEMTEVK